MLFTKVSSIIGLKKINVVEFVIVYFETNQRTKSTKMVNPIPSQRIETHLWLLIVNTSAFLSFLSIICDFMC